MGAAELKPYAASEFLSRGRLHQEPGPTYRGYYQRDRDRIIHSGAFRRLEYKTQVFVNHEGDMFRTRLTHSLEVAQLSRTIARSLQLNEDLTEAIALAHDLGHTPFGHAGQTALNDCMRPYGGFEHNLQSIRVVDLLEDRYAAFPGLNLSFETREGILKHCSRPNARSLGELGERFLLGRQPTLEAQIANIADEIAYNNHDVDDGLRAGLITTEDLNQVRSFRDAHDVVSAQWPGLAPRKAIHEVIRHMINEQVSDLIQTSLRAIEAAAPTSPDAVRDAGQGLIQFSPAARRRHLELKRFLRTALYRHHRVHRMSAKAGRIVRELFESFMQDPRLLPEEAYQRATGVGLPAAENRTPSKKQGLRARAVADYIAGMTDRYAIAEHQRLFDPPQLP